MNKHFFISLGFLIFFLTGCWDMVAIEERGFIIGTAIDLKEDQQSQQMNE